MMNKYFSSTGPELRDAAIEGDRDALEELVRRYQRNQRWSTKKVLTKIAQTPDAWPEDLNPELRSELVSGKASSSLASSRHQGVIKNTSKPQVAATINSDVDAVGMLMSLLQGNAIEFNNRRSEFISSGGSREHIRSAFERDGANLSRLVPHQAVIESFLCVGSGSQKLLSDEDARKFVQDIQSASRPTTY